MELPTWLPLSPVSREKEPPKPLDTVHSRQETADVGEDRHGGAPSRRIHQLEIGGEDFKDEEKADHNQRRKGDLKGNDEKKEDGPDDRPGEEDHMGRHDSENGPAGADHGRRGSKSENYMDERRGNATGQVKKEDPDRPHSIFNGLSENPQEEHVPHEVENTPVAELIRHEGCQGPQRPRHPMGHTR